MSRPLRLVYTPPTWASAGNFPAGANPWNAQPMRVVPAPSYFLPNTVPPAEYENYLHGVTLDGILTLENALLAAFDFLSPIQALNWPSNSGVYWTTGGTVTAGMSAIAWDLFARRWVSLEANSGQLALHNSFDQGATWSAVTGGSLVTGGAHPFGLIAHPTTGLICTFQNGLPYTFAAGAWTARTSPVAAFVASSGPNAVFGPFQGLFVALGSSAGAKVMSSPDLITWTDRSATIPAAMNTATSWIAAASGAIAVAAVYRGNSRVTMTTTDGITWAAGSIANGSLVSTDLITGLSYSAADGLFMMTFTGAANVGKVMTSPDGLTWTFVRSVTATPMVGLVALGSIWMCMSGSSLALSNKPIYSLDKGVTWAFGNVAGVTVDTSLNKDVLQVYAADTHLLAVNSSNTLGSLCAGSPPTF